MSQLPNEVDDPERNRAGAALRALGHTFVGHEADPALVTELADTLERFTHGFGVGDRRSRNPESFDKRQHQVAADGERLLTYDDRPFSGRSSPWGLDMDVHRRGDEIEARVTLGPAHEGAPGRTHGGIVAGLFDDVFGFVLDILQQPAFTGELTIRYVAPTPLGRRLACRGRLRERVGRKIYIEGELVDPDGADGAEVVVARGHGLFIAVDVDVMRSALLPAPPDES